MIIFWLKAIYMYRRVYTWNTSMRFWIGIPDQFQVKCINAELYHIYTTQFAHNGITELHPWWSSPECMVLLQLQHMASDTLPLCFTVKEKCNYPQNLSKNGLTGSTPTQAHFISKGFGEGSRRHTLLKVLTWFEKIMFNLHVCALLQV